MIKVYPTGDYPTQWDDLITGNGKTVATIATLEEMGKKREEISRGKDGVYDMAVFAQEINNEVARNALNKLSKRTRQKYQFICKQTHEDRIIAFANQLMKALSNYGNLQKGYDFSRCKTAKQKREVIGIWIGEILYDALVYKDADSVKSLSKVILAEIEELINL